LEPKLGLPARITPRRIPRLAARPLVLGFNPVASPGDSLALKFAAAKPHDYENGKNNQRRHQEEQCEF